VNVDATLWHECNTTLRLWRLVLGQVLEFVVRIFKVADVAITECG
jgi:hypothetical protein